MASELPLHVSILSRAVGQLHPPGGLERAVYEQVRHLDARGAALTVVTQPPDALQALNQLGATFGQSTKWRFVRYRTLPLRRGSVPDRLINYPLFVARMASALRQESAPVSDIVHAHGLTAVAAPTGPPLVLSPHGLEEFSRDDWRKWVAYAPMRQALRRTARRASAVLATDEHLASAVCQALGIGPDQVMVVPNGVSVAALDALVDPARGRALAARFGLDTVALRLVTCARLEANKGLDVMVRALAKHRDHLPATWGWWVIGTGHEETRLRQTILEFGLNGYVHLLGSLNDQDLHSLLSQADLFVLPSRYEGSSIATLEAMSHRLPVLATAVGGLPDKVVPGQTGYLTSPGDADMLGASLTQAIADHANWPRLGSAGRDLVVQRFDWPGIARLLLDLYATLRHPAPH